MLKHKKTAMVLGIGMAIWTMQAVGEQTGGHEHKAHGADGEEKVVHLSGEVIDIVCYVRMDAKGPKHVKCAEHCVKQGIPLGFLEAGTGHIYLIFPEGHGNPSEKVMAYIGKRVEVDGKVHNKGGLRGITIGKISEVKG